MSANILHIQFKYSIRIKVENFVCQTTISWTLVFVRIVQHFRFVLKTRRALKKFVQILIWNFQLMKLIQLLQLWRNSNTKPSCLLLNVSLTWRRFHKNQFLLYTHSISTRFSSFHYDREIIEVVPFDTSILQAFSN